MRFIPLSNRNRIDTPGQWYGNSCLRAGWFKNLLFLSTSAQLFSSKWRGEGAEGFPDRYGLICFRFGIVLELQGYYDRIEEE